VTSLHLPNLTLDGTSTPLESTPWEIERFYLPLANYITRLQPTHRRLLIGIGGPPASGKSVFTALLAAVINAAQGSPVALSLGLDGWHYPNSYLDTHTVLKDGVSVPLRKVKGAPPSFDATSALAFLRRMDSEDTLVYPVYSRQVHDPVPAPDPILPRHRIILFEGNYLLLNTPPWTSFHPLFDRTVFLRAPRELLLAGLRERHLRSGKDPTEVERHIAFSDLGNLDLILEHSVHPDIRVEKSDSRYIRDIIYP
jgi:putative kinase